MNNNLNKITCDVYPEWYEDQQKEEYLECLALGRAHLGNKITKTDEYLIELATKIAINQKYNKSANITQEQLTKLKEIHQENLTKTHITPPDGWYNSELNPLNRPYVPDILPIDSSNIIDDSSNLINGV